MVERLDQALDAVRIQRERLDLGDDLVLQDLVALLLTGREGVVLERALDLYHRRPDKPWAMTDCLSFVVMRERGLSEALTTDRHFSQAGFTILLK